MWPSKGCSSSPRCPEMGGGELCSKRTLTYLEGTGLVEGVLDPYLGGGQGSRNALKFLAAVLGLD